MRPRSWIRNLFARRPGHQPRAARRRATARLHLEPLERLLLPAPVLLSSYDGVDESLDAFLNLATAHIPPDPNAAIGTDHNVAVVNSTIEIRAKDGSGVPARAALFSFFGTSSSTNLFDSKVLWDRQSQRFFVVTLEKDNTSTSVIHLAVSPTGDPSIFSSWRKFSFDATETISGHNTWADYPGFGVDSAAIYVTANKFDFGAGLGGFEDSRLWIVNKANLINGTLTQNRYAPPGRGFTMQPAQMYQDLPTGPGTFLTRWPVGFGSGNQLTITRVASPLSNPTFTTYNLDTGLIDSVFATLPNAPQAGSSALINTGDRRILSAVWSHGQLFATNTINPVSGPDQGRATAHWYRIDTSNLNNVFLADQGNIDGAGVLSNLYTYYPSVTVDDAGNMAVGFSASNATDTPVGAFYTARLAGDPAGYTEPIAFLRGGDDWNNQTDGSGRNRWGDYSGAGLDPDGHTLFFFNEYPGTRNAFYPNGRWVTHYGTTAYATHYRLVTAGGVTTLTTDNSVTSVGLTRSGSSTQISVNFANIGSTTAATITVQAGWSGTTFLDVTNPANGTFSLTGSQFVSPGLTVNFSNLGDLVLDGGAGNNTWTVANTPASGPGHQTLLSPGTGTDIVNVQATTGALTVICQGGGGNSVVNLGNANSLAGIAGAVTVDGFFSNRVMVNVNDGADNAAHPNVVLNSTSLTGLAPAAINFGPADVSGLTINGGNGSNTYTVANTQAGLSNPIALNTGNGADTVNVQATSSPLTVNAGGTGTDVVNVGNANSVAGIQGALTLNNDPSYSHVNINDGADNANHPNVILTASSLTGLAPATITFQANSLNRLTITGGNGINTYTVVNTPRSGVGDPTTLNTGNGTDTVNIQATDATAPLTVTGNPAGVNTLVGPNAATTWHITGADAGNLSSTAAVSFTGYGNLTGGSGSNAFIFSDGASLSGSLAGGGGATLDYSAYSTSVVVDLQPAVASGTGVGGSISGFTNVIGASGAPGTPGLYNLLIGSDVGGDTLQGGTGRRNILVAGGGASTLIGGDGEDLLIGGTTAYDTEPGLPNWQAIADYWAGTDDFATRSANLLSGNGVPLLDPTTVTGNGGGNVMQGNGGTALIYTDGQDSIDNFFATSLVNIAP
jgi:hypothetical protein